jgi:hypothetical protein
MTEEELIEAIAQGKQIECFVYKSTDALNWEKSGRAFLPSQRQQEMQDEDRRLEQYKEMTRRADPRGAYRSYAFRIECFEAGQAPERFIDDLRRNYRF